MLKTTLGQLVVNEALPEDMRNYGRVIDKKELSSLLRDLALKHPDKYVDVTKRLSDIGRTVATRSGGNSFGLSHISKSPVARKRQLELKAKLKEILDDDDLDEDTRHSRIVTETGRVMKTMPDEVYEESLKEKNPLAYQVLSGSRGNRMNLNELRGTGLLFADHRDHPIPLPILSSYSEGMKPVEYWAGTYGARKGIMSTKFATQEAGFLSKQLNQVNHRLMVVDEDDPREFTHPRGLPVATDDADNEGSLLAHDIGGYKRNTVLSPKILKHIKAQGHDRIIVRSPAVGGSPDGGVYARDVGVREYGRIPGRGEQVGLQAAQALSEPLSQAQLGAKHTGGVAGADKAVGGFQYINQLIQVPKAFKGGAAHAEDDGTVEDIQEAPAGGYFVTVGGKRHYVGQGYELKVKKGDKVEAGDALSEGAANPDMATRHKGIGEGRRIFTNTMMSAMRSAGLKANRRNVELLSRGLINHVRLDEEWNGHLPDEVLPYSTLEHLYEPREDHAITQPAKAIGKYLERPVLHYTIGTKIRPSVMKDLQHFGINEIAVHNDPPPFQPEMIRGMYSLQHDPDWMTRMYGSGLKGSLLDAAHSGAKSNELGTSFVPGLARAVEFGQIGSVKQPEQGRLPPAEGVPFPDFKRPTTPIALDVKPPTPAAPPKGGILSGFGSLFKGSEDYAQEAREILEKVARSAENGIGRSDLKMQQERKPQPAPPASPPNPAPAPKPAAPPSMPAPVTPTRAPAPVQPAPPVTSGPTTQTAVNPGQVHPARAQGSDPWAGSHTPPDPNYGRGRNPHAMSTGGYAPGMGLAGQMSPEQMAHFVQGGEDHGGFLGSATRFGSLLDSNAVGALTNQSPYVRGDYGYQPEHQQHGEHGGVPMGAGMPGMGGFHPGFDPGSTGTSGSGPAGNAAAPAAGGKPSWLGQAGQFWGEAMHFLPEKNERTLGESALKIPLQQATWSGGTQLAGAALAGARNLLWGKPPPLVGPPAPPASLGSRLAAGARSAAKTNIAIDALFNSASGVRGLTGNNTQEDWDYYANYSDDLQKKNVLEKAWAGTMPIRPYVGAAYNIADANVKQMELAEQSGDLDKKRWQTTYPKYQEYMELYNKGTISPSQLADLGNWHKTITRWELPPLEPSARREHFEKLQKGPESFSELVSNLGKGMANSPAAKLFRGDLGYAEGKEREAIRQAEKLNQPDQLARVLVGAGAGKLTAHQRQQAEKHFKENTSVPEWGASLDDHVWHAQNRLRNIQTMLTYAGSSERKLALEAAKKKIEEQLALRRSKEKEFKDGNKQWDEYLKKQGPLPGATWFGGVPAGNSAYGALGGIGYDPYRKEPVSPNF